MEVHIYNRDLELTDRLSDYVHKKVEKFDRYLNNIEDVRVDLSSTNARNPAERMVAQITIHVPGTILRAEERANDIFAAFDEVMDKVERRVKRYKGRRQARRTEPAPAMGSMSAAPDLEAEELIPPAIVRVKRFEVGSITPEEAVDQMELLGHYFFIFLDATDGQLSVVYKRNDGDYGMLKPIY
jgi:putative sigma-54 modulation protein